MISIRRMIEADEMKVRRLHKEYYDQFEYPQFMQCLNAFVITDEEGDIVLAGCVEKVAEVMLVTNKEKSRIKIGRALVEAQGCAVYTCMVNGIRDMYAFVDDEDYARHLLKHGFDEGHRALKLRIR